ncbi:MAG: DEAD/DEAH box helicase [Chloroflexi bacterium]|nr:DEAD/DEAH box helicase [Chloroflexota bacterium]MYE38880.1 DEAD/DEAH box helicase [Chloroflexota bacterium]
MAELRDYQQDLLEQAEAALQPRDARVMLQLPTGGGKTHIAGALLRRWLHDGRKAAWLTHRTELADQTRLMLEDTGVPASNRISWRVGNDAPYLTKGVVILMAQTVSRRTNQMQIWDRYRSSDLLVIDEAHHATADGYVRAIRQWTGRVLGLTATPWRLSKIEGFDHLFGQLLCGPQVSELQANNHLCQARVLMPRPGETISGGSIDDTGDYNPSGIEQANQDRPDVMTAGALRFWQFHAAERQTVVYAISKDHARNLVAVFKDAGIPAAVMLDDTLPDERANAIKSFGNGSLRVLVNVAVATEGFDLPDASCVVITRPTMSLALYLQMVGRGLRPKANGGNCLILDLAGNAEIHGLPEDDRQWSLNPRGNKPGSEAPVIRCEKCNGVSPAASQNCPHCGTPFGKDCPRCGVWRAWQRWGYETRCGQQHELVCDLCHYDAHIQAQLPITDELRRLTEMEPDLDAAIRHLLEEERRRASGADEERKRQLSSLISHRKSELASDSLLKAFKNHIAALPVEDRPKANWTNTACSLNGKTA